MQPCFEPCGARSPVITPAWLAVSKEHWLRRARIQPAHVHMHMHTCIILCMHYACMHAAATHTTPTPPSLIPPCRQRLLASRDGAARSHHP